MESEHFFQVYSITDKEKQNLWLYNHVLKKIVWIGIYWRVEKEGGQRKSWAKYLQVRDLHLKSFQASSLPSGWLGNTEIKNVVTNEVPDSQCFIYVELIRVYLKVSFDYHILVSHFCFTPVYTLNIINFQLSSGMSRLQCTSVYLSEFKACHWFCLLSRKRHIHTCCTLLVVLEQKNKSFCDKIFLIVVTIRVVQQLNRSFKAMTCILVDLFIFFIVSIFSKVYKITSSLNAELRSQRTWKQQLFNIIICVAELPFPSLPKISWHDLFAFNLFL